MAPDNPIGRRAFRALVNALPPTAEVHPHGDHHVLVNGEPLQIRWIGEGWLADARAALDELPKPDVVAAKRMSPGARKVLADAGTGWVDEAGAAEIAIGSIIVSKCGRPAERANPLTSWTPAVLAVTEAVLIGTKPTVSAAHKATGLSVGSCTNALRFLAEQELLVAEVKRGRRSARKIRDFSTLLRAYADAVAAEDPAMTLEVGITWRDPALGLAETAEHWSDQGRAWACTGAVAASVLAPYLTTVGRADVYLDADTFAGLEAAAREAGLDPIEGGRLSLRPFPTVTCRTLSTKRRGLNVVPWPRVYADLRLIGVRGEEAAEHLLEVMHGG